MVKSKGLKLLWRFTKGTAAFYCVGHCISKYIGEMVICSGPSMHPTIHDGDLVLAERFSIRNKNVQVGDIVGCVNPQKPKELLCKRIAAKEGDPVTSHLLPSGRVPIGHVFLRGDNGPVSTDSRHFGPVPEALVQIRLSLRIWPPERAGWISDHWFWDKSDRNAEK
ncbi:Peptidase S26 domain-containing protein [Caenorhabditis elegans]|uniref:Peptidase S26 domain-containing protein n=1 Tax=Caenorhabditis elegans TaxID=6239 RepID=Q9XVD2_CAEEL|nr:Peptidase S26 domain-containing protein [Caenorhabditis elegans]CAB03913.3 Peptidase S26 domain-containing protein [Caenorhabditis elegans]